MLAASLVMWSAELGRAINLTDACMKYFPNGVPTKKGYDDVWTSQKVTPIGKLASDNLLDTREWWSPYLAKIIERQTPKINGTPEA